MCTARTARPEPRRLGHPGTRSVLSVCTSTVLRTTGSPKQWRAYSARHRAMDYVYLRAWERSAGTAQPFVEQQLELARKDNAPADALFCRDTGGATGGLATGEREWVRLTDLPWGSDIRKRVESCARDVRKGGRI